MQISCWLKQCTTLSDLRLIKKRFDVNNEYNKKLLIAAYKFLSESDRDQVDRITATSVPHTVYRYTGPKRTTEHNGHLQTLFPGRLVYSLDSGAGRGSLKVYSVAERWVFPILVTSDYLVLIKEKEEKKTENNNEQKPLFE